MAPSLSLKEVTLFQTALQQYEKKEYKDSLENVEKLQTMVPDHGESMCLKGLLLHHLGKKGGLECIQQGVKLDPDSSVAWHMAGIFYRLAKSYPEALRAYTKSYRLNKENGSVQHDLAMLSMQERDIPLLVQSRNQMLGAKPNVKMLWVGLAIAHYLNKDYAAALKTLTLHENMMANDPATRAPKPVDEMHQQDIETSELAYFKNLVIWKGQGAKTALADLRDNESKIWDKLSVSERRAELLTADGQTNAAKKAYKDLVRRNPENSRYYKALHKLSGEDAVGFYKRTVAEFPTANWPKGEYLCQVSKKGDVEEFSKGLKAYLEKWLIQKGTPAAFEFVKQFYGSQSKAVSDVVSSLDLDTENVVQQVFLARHQAYTGDITEAVATVSKLPENNADVALAHAKILQIAGDYRGAAKILANASEADAGDRFLNTKAAKYALRAGDIDAGLTLATVFPMAGDKTRTKETALTHLIELESVDFFSQLAQNLQRIGEHALAFKYANVVLDIFTSYHKEQFDFHYYGPRRGTITAYLQLIEWEDKLWTHPRLRQCLAIAVEEAYFASGTPVPDASPVEEEPAENPAPEGEKDSTETVAKDTDPTGLILFTSPTALETAFNTWNEVKKALPSDPQTWMLSFDIYLVQKKYVLAIQALKKAKEFGATSQWIAAAAVRARYTLETDTAAPEVLRKLQLKLLPTIANEGDIVNDDLAEYANKYVRSDGSLELWVKTRAFLPTDMADVDAALVDVVPKLSASECQSLLFTLTHAHSKNDGAKLASAIKKAYPLASFVN